MKDDSEIVKIKVKVLPRGAKDQILGMDQGEIKIKLTAPPVEGKANEALKRFLAKKLGLKKKSIEIVKGIRSRTKIIEIRGMAKEELLRSILNKSLS